MTYNVPEIAWAPLVPIIVVLVAGAVGVLLEAFMRNVALPFDTYYAARTGSGRDGDGTFSKTL